MIACLGIFYDLKIATLAERVNAIVKDGLSQITDEVKEAIKTLEKLMRLERAGARGTSKASIKNVEPTEVWRAESK